MEQHVFLRPVESRLGWASGQDRWGKERLNGDFKVSRSLTKQGENISQAKGRDCAQVTDGCSPCETWRRMMREGREKGWHLELTCGWLGRPKSRVSGFNSGSFVISYLMQKRNKVKQESSSILWVGCGSPAGLTWAPHAAGGSASRMKLGRLDPPPP